MCAAVLLVLVFFVLKRLSGRKSRCFLSGILAGRLSAAKGPQRAVLNSARWYGNPLSSRALEMKWAKYRCLG